MGLRGTPPLLTLVHDASRLAIGGVRLSIGATAPFALDARALEDDRFHVLAADRAFREPAGPPLLVHTQALEAQPARPGAVIGLGTRPRTLLAIVHDLDESPTCREAWVADAYRSITHLARAEGLRHLSLPLLGTRFGGLCERRAAALLIAALRADQNEPGAVIERVFVPVGEADARQIYEALLYEAQRAAAPG